MKKQKVKALSLETCPPQLGGQPAIGHNGGPDLQDDIKAEIEAKRLFKVIGPRRDEPLAPFDTGPAWVQCASPEELARLEILHRWITLRERGLADLKEEHTRIMRRCIKRGSRKNGKPRS